MESEGVNKYAAFKLVSKVLGGKLSDADRRSLWADTSPILRAARDQGLDQLLPDPPPDHPIAVRRRAARDAALARARAYRLSSACNNGGKPARTNPTETNEADNV